MISKLSPGAKLVANALVAEGVTSTFGVTGSHVIDLFQALYEAPDIGVVAARHECGAALMAAAYARVSGNVGICVTTAGPGALNALNGLAQAQFSGLPVICFSGGVPVEAVSFDLHGLNHENYCIDAFGAIVKLAVRIQSLSCLADEISRAFQVAQSGRPGPVYIEIPWDLLSQMERYEHVTYKKSLSQPKRYCAGIVDSIIAVIAGSNAVALVLDKGILGNPVITQLIRIAEARGLPIVTTRDALGLVPESHPCYAGVLHGHYFGAFAAETLNSVESCLCFGFDPGSNNRRAIEQTSGCCASFVESMVGESSENCDGKTLDEILHLVSEQLELAVNEHTPQLSIGKHRAESVHKFRSSLEGYAFQKPIHFGYALSVLAKYLPDDSITLLDAGSHEVWGRTVLPVNSELSLIGGNDWASMGFAIPATVGARVAYPKRRLVCLTGDGCLLMSLSDLSTLIQAGGPTVVVNLNDSEYGMMSQVQLKKFGRIDGTDLPKTDFARIATEFAGIARRVEDPGELDEVFAEALDSDAPYFVDVICDSNSAYPVYE